MGIYGICRYAETPWELETGSLTTERDCLLMEGLTATVVETIQRSRAPSIWLLYSLKWQVLLETRTYLQVLLKWFCSFCNTLQHYTRRRCSVTDSTLRHSGIGCRRISGTHIRKWHIPSKGDVSCSPQRTEVTYVTQHFDHWATTY